MFRHCSASVRLERVITSFSLISDQWCVSHCPLLTHHTNYTCSTDTSSLQTEYVHNNNNNNNNNDDDIFGLKRSTESVKESSINQVISRLIDDKINPGLHNWRCWNCFVWNWKTFYNHIKKKRSVWEACFQIITIISINKLINGFICYFKLHLFKIVSVSH